MRTFFLSSVALLGLILNGCGDLRQANETGSNLQSGMPIRPLTVGQIYCEHDASSDASHSNLALVFTRIDSRYDARLFEKTDSGMHLVKHLGACVALPTDSNSADLPLPIQRCVDPRYVDTGKIVVLTSGDFAGTQYAYVYEDSIAGTRQVDHLTCRGQ